MLRRLKKLIISEKESGFYVNQLLSMMFQSLLMPKTHGIKTLLMRLFMITWLNTIRRKSLFLILTRCIAGIGWVNLRMLIKLLRKMDIFLELNLSVVHIWRRSGREQRKKGTKTLFNPIKRVLTGTIMLH